MSILCFEAPLSAFLNNKFEFSEHSTIKSGKFFITELYTLLFWLIKHYEYVAKNAIESLLIQKNVKLIKLNVYCQNFISSDQKMKLFYQRFGWNKISEILEANI